MENEKWRERVKEEGKKKRRHEERERGKKVISQMTRNSHSLFCLLQPPAFIMSMLSVMSLREWKDTHFLMERRVRIKIKEREKELKLDRK